MSSLTTAFSPNPIDLTSQANKSPHADAQSSSKAKDTSASAAPGADSVTISTQARIQSLKNSGNSVQQIAISLDLTTAEVDQQLGITPTTASAQALEVAGLLS